MKKFGFLIVGVGVVIAAVGCRELSRQPAAAVYIQPSVAPDSSKPWYFPLTKSAGDWTVQPNWMVSQWGIPVDLDGGQTVASGADWNIANGYARLKYYAASKTYELAQNGQTPGARPCGTEVDLFISPVGGNYPTYPQGNAVSKSLDLLDNLAFRLGANVTYENIQVRCRQSGNVDYVSYAASFVFSSTTGQTLFYQIQLRQNGLSYPIPNMAWCPNNNDPSTAHSFCIGDDIHYVDGNSNDLSVGTHVTYQVDMLQRVKQVLQSGYRRGDGSSEMIDGNIAHWTLTGMYIGSMIQGGANIAAQYDSFCLIEQQKGDSTNNTVCQ